MKNICLVAIVALWAVGCQKADNAAGGHDHKAMLAHDAQHKKLEALSAKMMRFGASAASLDSMVALYAPNAKSISVFEGQVTEGREKIKAMSEGYWKAFPDMKVELKATHYHENHIIWEQRLTATNTGPMMGPDGKEAKASGKKMDVSMVTVLVVNDEGLITEERTYFDTYTFMKQMGWIK